MTESMRRAQVIGDSPASRVRATGLGSPLDSYGHDVACGDGGAR